MDKIKSPIEIMQAAINALRLEINEDIVNDIQKKWETVKEQFTSSVNKEVGGVRWVKANEESDLPQDGTEVFTKIIFGKEVNFGHGFIDTMDDGSRRVKWNKNWDGGFCFAFTESFEYIICATIDENPSPIIQDVDNEDEVKKLKEIIKQMTADFAEKLQNKIQSQDVGEDEKILWYEVESYWHDIFSDRPFNERVELRKEFKSKFNVTRNSLSIK